MSMFVSLNDLQARVIKWFHSCFNAEALADKGKRNSRFFEEAVELVQAGGMSESEAHALVKHKYSQPVGDLKQEAGGVLTTYIAWLESYGFKLDDVALAALLDAYERIDIIRNKVKPDFSKPVAPGSVCRNYLVKVGSDVLPRSCPTCGVFGNCRYGFENEPIERKTIATLA